MKTIYIPLIMKPWGSVQIIGIPFEAPFDVDASFGEAFMPVFACKEEAKKHYPNAEILEADLPTEETNHD